MSTATIREIKEHLDDILKDGEKLTQNNKFFSSNGDCPLGNALEKLEKIRDGEL